MCTHQRPHCRMQLRRFISKVHNSSPWSCIKHTPKTHLIIFIQVGISSLEAFSFWRIMGSCSRLGKRTKTSSPANSVKGSNQMVQTSFACCTGCTQIAMEIIQVPQTIPQHVLTWGFLGRHICVGDGKMHIAMLFSCMMCTVNTTAQVLPRLGHWCVSNVGLVE